jgi:hypothetical protein
LANGEQKGKQDQDAGKKKEEGKGKLKRKVETLKALKKKGKSSAGGKFISKKRVAKPTAKSTPAEVYERVVVSVCMALVVWLLLCGG